MKIKVTIKDRTYEISCGSGIQDLAWLSLTASYLYGKDSYPKGNFVPTLLTNSDGRVNHPRRRIKDTLTDGEVVYVRLRDLSEPQEKECVKWYERAFGSKRNIMKCFFSYTPKAVDFNNPTRVNAKVVLKFSFSIFNELKNEFSEADYPNSYEIELYPEEGRKIFKRVMKFPFGEIGKKRVCEILAQNRDGEGEARELHPDEHMYAEVVMVPWPWSKKQMKEAMIKEEQEQKKREDELLKKAHDQSVDQAKYSAMAVMNLYDVWPEAPTSLAPHFPLLSDVFSLYANFHYPDENMVSVHDFFHFLRTFDLVQEMEDIFQYVVSLGEELGQALEDPLALSISLYQFLYFLVKFAEMKYPEDTEYSLIIEKIGKSKSLWLQDHIKSEMLQADIFEKFMEYEDYLKNKYLSVVTPVQGHRIEVRVPDFITMVQEMEEHGIEDLVQYTDDTLNFNVVKHKEMLYPDFLETILRIAQAIPLTVEHPPDLTDTQILSISLASFITRFCDVQSRAQSRGNA